MPEMPSGEKTVGSGVALDLLPGVTVGKITLSGKLVLRRRLVQDGAQPLRAMNFATHETFFRGAVEEGKEIADAVGDGQEDQSRIIFVVKLLP
ncbi:MAG: hypothetical protein JWL90_1881 [Chthoniobacteraceae bacterium]|nr:hypothetical protein [Chthoniobacteraceae bacterium]